MGDANIIAVGSLKFGLFIDDGFTPPKRATKGSSCFDIFLCLKNDVNNDVDAISGTNLDSKICRGPETKLKIPPRYRVKIKTGLYFDIPSGFSVRIHPRSGLSYKTGLILANCEGIVDSDYVEEVCILLHNTSDVYVELSDGDRIAQFELVADVVSPIEVLSEKPKQKTERNGGFGSTGK